MSVLDRAALLDVLQRTMDNGWLAPLQDDADSSAVLNALADALAYLSTLGQEAADNSTISLSSGGTSGTALVTLTRASAGTTGTIPAGYQFIDARGFVAITQSAISVTLATSTIVVPVATLRLTELANTIFDPVFSISPTNSAVADGGGTNALVSPTPAPVGYPPIVATTFTAVVSSTNIDGGSSDWLSAVGEERGQLRQAGEEADTFRLRVRNVPDAVSPVAISQAVAAAASHASLPQPITVEPFNDGASAAARGLYGLDFSDAVYMSGTLGPTGDAATSPQEDFFSDAGLDGITGRPKEMVSLRTARAYFREDVPGPLADPDEGRMFFDDAFFDDPVFGFPDAPPPQRVAASLMAIWEEANRKRAAGVRFDVYVGSAQRIAGAGDWGTTIGSTAAVGPTVVWTAQPPVGKVWLYADGIFSFDTATAQQPSASRYQQVRFTFDDASVFLTDRDTTSWGVRLGGPIIGAPSPRITKVEGLAGGNGVTVHSVGEFFVWEATA